MKLTENEIEAMEQTADELKKCAHDLSYAPPSTTKVQLTPSWRYKKVIMLPLQKTNMGAKVEKQFAELDQLHQEYESWRAKSITDDNEEEFTILVDIFKGTFYDIADKFQQIAQSAREALGYEKPAETKLDITPTKWGRIWNCIKKIPKWIYILVLFLAALFTIFHYLGWL